MHSCMCVCSKRTCNKYHSSNEMHPYLSLSLSLSKYLEWQFSSSHLLSSNTLSCVLLSHIYPLLLQFPCSESVTLFCFSSGVSVSFEFNSHRTLPTLVLTIYTHATHTRARTVTHKLGPPPQEQPNTRAHTRSMFQREWCLTGTSDSSLITSSL